MSFDPQHIKAELASFRIKLQNIQREIWTAKNVEMAREFNNFLQTLAAESERTYVKIKREMG